MGAAVRATDTRGRVTFMTPTAKNLPGGKPAEAAGRPLTEVEQSVNAETREPLDSLVPQALLEGVVAGPTSRAVLISRNGSETPIDDSAAPVRDNAGQITGVVLTFRDDAFQQRLRH